MATYEKILIATDLGENTLSLLERAKTLSTSDTFLTLLHVIRPIETKLFGDMPYTPIFSTKILPIIDYDKIKEHVINTKTRQIEALAKKYDLGEKSYLMEIGNPKNVITDFAQSNKYDLIITASKHVKSRNPYLGSTARAILQNAHCDVLVVHIEH